MPFRLDPTRPLIEAVRELARAELGSAARWALKSTRGSAGSRRAHEIRKSMKRLRALLRLLRSAMRKTDYKALNHECRDIARALAVRRDADVREATLTEMMTGVAPLLRAAIEEQLAAMRGEPRAPTATTTTATPGSRRASPSLRTRLQALAVRFEKLALHVPEAALAKGLRHGLRKVREARAVAINDPTNDAFHELRKAIQIHQRHLQLLASADPRTLKVRAKAVGALAQLLGREHDLSMLVVWVERQSSTAATKRIMRECRRMKQKLRQRALADCRPFLAKKPKQFTRDLVKPWHWSQVSTS